MKEISARDAAEMLRKELKRAFPNTKFSVRVERRFHITVRWEDGAPYNQVVSVTDRFNGSEYDLLNDTWRTLHGVLNGEMVMFNTHIMLERIISDSLWLKTAERVAREYGLPMPTVADRNSDWGYIPTGTGECAHTIINRLLNG